MKRGDIIRYVDMTIEEGFSIQRGMNFNVANKEYCIILMPIALKMMEQQLFTKVMMFNQTMFRLAKIQRMSISL